VHQGCLITTTKLARHLVASGSRGKEAQPFPPWTQWTFWQFSGSLQLDNLPGSDFNAFNGTYAELRDFAKRQCVHQ